MKANKIWNKRIVPMIEWVTYSGIFILCIFGLASAESCIESICTTLGI